MSLFVASLNSGSNGNCYYIGNDEEAVLIDAGISCRETERRMKRLGLQMEKVKAICISHEHSDHIRGIRVLSKKYNLPVYVTNSTARNGRLEIDPTLAVHFTAFEKLQVGRLQVTPFPKFHDACDPYSFMVGFNGINVGVFTDIGSPCSNVIRYFKLCHAAILEANYDVQMLANSNYPYYLKSRISGGNGHLSNDQALEIFRYYRAPFLSHLLLGHLSQNNNCPHLVEELFYNHCGDVKIVMASRSSETQLFEIGDNSRPNAKRAIQQSLFA